LGGIGIGFWGGGAGEGGALQTNGSVCTLGDER
jgi:hypothetical protein